MVPTTPLNPTASAVGVVDSTARVSLPAAFANATVVIDQFGDDEVRIRKAVVPEAELKFLEEQIPPLSDRDRDLLLDLIDNPPEATPALKAAIADYKRRYG